LKQNNISIGEHLDLLIKKSDTAPKSKQESSPTPTRQDVNELTNNPNLEPKIGSIPLSSVLNIIIDGKSSSN